MHIAVGNTNIAKEVHSSQQLPRVQGDLFIVQLLAFDVLLQRAIGAVLLEDFNVLVVIYEQFPGVHYRGVLLSKVPQELEVHCILGVDANRRLVIATGHRVVRVVLVFGTEQLRIFSLDQQGVAIDAVRFVGFLRVRDYQCASLSFEVFNLCAKETMRSLAALFTKLRQHLLCQQASHTYFSLQ